MRGRLPAALALVAATAIAACSGSGEGGDDALALRVTVDSAGGFRRVRNAGVPARWRLDSAIAVSEADGRPFGRIAGVVGDWRGGIYVADADARVIHRFDARGSYLGSVGGEGAGAGQFRQMAGLAWVGGRLASLDAGSGRITLLPADGEGDAASIGWAAPDGEVRLEQTRPGEAYAPVAVRDGGGGAGVAHIRLLGAGTPDTLRVRSRQAGGNAVVTCRLASGTVTFDIPFAPRPFAARAPDMRSVTGHTGSYRLAVLDARGDTLQVMERELPAVPVGDEDWAGAQEQWTLFQEEHAGASCDASVFQRPVAKPAFRDVYWGDGGRLWVEAAAPVGFRFDVFDSTGVLVGELPAPDRDPTVPVAIRSGWFYWSSTGSGGVRTVHAARLVEP